MTEGMTDACKDDWRFPFDYVRPERALSDRRAFMHYGVQNPPLLPDKSLKALQ